MSPKIHLPSLAAGLLSALGLIGSATCLVAAPQDPGAAAPASAPAEGQAPPAPSGPPTVLLLTNGKVLQGEILRTRRDTSSSTRSGSCTSPGGTSSGRSTRCRKCMPTSSRSVPTTTPTSA